jgi:hypothetical protein
MESSCLRLSSASVADPGHPLNIQKINEKKPVQNAGKRISKITSILLKGTVAGFDAIKRKR